MKSRSKLFLGIFIVLILLGLVYFLINSLSFFKGNELYYNRVKKNGNLRINYPYFRNKNMNEIVKNYIKSISKELYDEVNYEINITDDYTSILFNGNKNNNVNGYHSLLFDSEGKEQKINFIVNNEELLKEKIKIYLDNNNINLDINAVKYDYYLTKENLVVILTTKENDANISTKLTINYNELDEILKIKFEKNEEYIKKLTTTTTTTTITKAITTTTKVLTDNGNKVIAFTFDDGPSKYTSLIMDILDKYGAKATFFEVGYMMRNRKSMVKEVVDRGFEVGNHTTDHSNLNKLSADKVKEKVDDNNALFYEITGQNFPLLRPPYGNCKSSVKELISVPIIKWSVDSRDWESRNRDKIVSLVKSNTKSGDIVLFHDLYESTYEAIKVLVPYYYEKGYKIVSVSELFALNGKNLEGYHIYYSAK